MGGLPKLDFLGLMADVTSVNYNAICNIYDGDSNVPLVGEECTCVYQTLTLISYLFSQQNKG